MTAKVLTIAAALGLLIGSSAIGLAENSVSDKAPGQKIPEKVLMNPKVGAANDTPGRLIQENGAGGVAFAPAQSTTGSAGTSGANTHQ